MNRPVFTLIAGANGAGKSTLTSGNPESFGASLLLDPDTSIRPLRSGDSTFAMAAGREVLRLAKMYLERGESVSIETTLSGRNYFKMMEDAKSRGFEVVLVYIGTESVEINLARITKRVFGGGHHVPEVDVRRRYDLCDLLEWSYDATAKRHRLAAPESIGTFGLVGPRQ